MTNKNTVPFDLPVAPHADGGPARRCLLRAIATAGTAALLLGAPSLAARAADPIKIGILLPLSGNFTENGQQTLTGLKMYFDEVGNKAAGHPLTLFVEDTQGKPDVAVTKARKLVQGDGVAVLTGVVTSGEAIAINAFSRDNKEPLVLSGDAGADELTMPGPLANPYLVRTSQNGRMVAAVGADWAYKKGWRKVATIGSDYAGGVDVNFAFAQAFCRLGGKVSQAEWPPIDTPDFGPYLTNLDRTADAVVTFEPGADGLRLARQFSEFGLKGKLPVLDLYAGLVYEPNLPQLGDATLGMYSSPVLFADAQDAGERALRRRIPKADALLAVQRGAERLCRRACDCRCDQCRQRRSDGQDEIHGGA